MPMPSQSKRSLPIDLLVLLAGAVVLYLLMLANALNTPAGGGEALMAAAFAAVFITAGLWIVLAVMLAVGGIMGAMPRWAALLAILLVPLSGVAAFVAIDMSSRHMRWAVVFPALLPPLIASYAFWARLPHLHAALPAQRTSLAVWAAILILSVAPLLLAM